MNTKNDSQKSYESIEGIAIIGMVGRFPGAINIQSFWQNLQNGVESLSLFTDEELIAAGIPQTLVSDSNYIKVGGVLENIDSFDAAFFDLNPKEAEVTDPQHRMFLECAWEALENAGYDSTKCKSRIGVYAGASLNNYLSFDLNNDQLGSGESYQKLIGNDKGFLSTRVSYKLNLTGPSITVQTACSTSLVATILACQSLQNYQCDMALAGGVSIRLPQKTGYFYEPGGPLSPDGHCHAFDAKAQGTAIGNGVGVVVLKRVQDAIASGDCIYAVIKGAAINNDGSMKVGYTAPSVDGQAEAIAEAVMLAEIEPETISYIEAHGSGTALGDPIEIAALTKVFRASTEKKNFCAIGSVKTNIGHLDAAAGVAGLIKTALALKHQLIPPSLNFEQPNPQIDFANSPFYVNTKPTAWKTDSIPRRAGVSSLGMGGTNAHIVLEEAPALPVSSPARPWQLLVLSAKTESALEAITQNLNQHLILHPDLNLADVAYTLQVGRRDFSHRRILVCSDTQDAINALNQQASQAVSTQFQKSGTSSVAFIFPGEGALYVNMGKELYETDLMFREQVDRCCLILKSHLELDLCSLIYPSESEQETALEKLKQSCFAKSALFVIEYALAQLWMSWGISPQAMIGHGIGEHVAATLAGVFCLEDALALVAKEFSTELLQKIQLNPPIIPFISNASGTWITQAQAIDPNYWTQQQEASHFNKGISELIKDSQRILLEVGCGENLITEELAVLTSIPHPHHQHSDVAFLLNTLGRLWMMGINIDWSGFYANESRHRLPLPTYPFERQRYWLESIASQKLLNQNPPSHPVENRRYSIELDSSSISETASWQSLDKKPNITDWFYIPVWKQSMPLEFFQGEEPSKQKLRCLVFVDSYGVGTEFTKRLEQNNHHVITVRAGEKFSKLDDQMYVINPQQPDEYDLLLQALNKQNFKPNAISHFWSVTPNDTLLNNEPEFLEDLQYLGFYSLLFLTQAIGKQDIWDTLKLMVVTSNLHDVTGDENLCPQKATLLGPCKVIPKEYRNINCSIVDLVIHSAQTCFSQKLIDNLVAELTLQQINEIVAYRGYYRWIQTFEAIPLDEEIGGKTRLREGGVYLITGGLGGIGLVLAEHLAKTLQAKLILIGRGALPERSEWEQWLVTHDPQDIVSRKIQKVRSLEALGVEVEIKSADVTNFEQMQAIIAQVLQKFGHINGVIHAAGIPGGGVTQLKTRDMASNVLAAKVKGTLILEEIFKNVNLDFFMLCSSKTSILGEFGQIDYCAANAFMDAYAHYHTSTSDRLTVSISWDIWQEVGFAVETVLPDKIKQEREEIIKKGILPKEGIDAFNRILGIRLPHLVVSTQDLPTLIKQNNSAQYLEKQLTLIEEKLSSVNLSKAKHPRPNLGNDYVAPKNEIEQMLVEIWQDILGIEKIGIYDNFFELGGNSINTIQIAAKANQLGLKLTSQQFFHYQTIDELAADLCITQTNQQEQGLGSKELPLLPIQNLFLKQNQPDIHHCNQSLLLEIQQACDLNLLEQALQSLIQHHDIFRLRFVEKESGWQQTYTSSYDTIEIKRVDLSALPKTELKLAIESQAAELETSLNLFEGPLVRFAFFELAPQQSSYLLIIIHHLAVDSVSWHILLEDLQIAYQQISQDKAINLPNNTTSYAQWVEYLQEYAQSSEILQEQDYWLQEAQKPFSRLPVDYSMSENTDNIIDNSDTVSVCLNKKETKTLLEEIHKAYNTQINDFLLTAFVQAFAKWTGQHTLRLDIQGNGRKKYLKNVDISRTVGSFSIYYPAILDITESSEVGESLIAIKEYLRGVSNNGIDYTVLQYLNHDQELQSKLQPLSISEVSFNYLGQYDQVISDSSLFSVSHNYQSINYTNSTRRTYLLEINAIVIQEQLQLYWTYSKTIYHRETIESLANNVIAALQYLMIHCQSLESERYTPSDFSRAKLSQQKLDNLLLKINQRNQ
ncbi:MAG: KR domain-containing protein [Cyanomargarita calcarea GSE-NOS-MK-12-04C]|jgi:non-ribosomal peptide synthase protein (TIGR01720 family)|uniref:Phenolphthiocerol/phthiocerol polyketide synthase subunit E n=1 Tax=Cyanomargarita calcarea GSE-NOS-MK-12-04C TaxID=2839659 RepID=A0A951QIB5_9CYAN|nr:KR domain-containing protein [Cyanomargarita calcarea GSE-NOS-MK-12-04C]